jgi:hypothetical protein
VFLVVFVVVFHRDRHAHADAAGRVRLLFGDAPHRIKAEPGGDPLTGPVGQVADLGPVGAEVVAAGVDGRRHPGIHPP